MFSLVFPSPVSSSNFHSRPVHSPRMLEASALMSSMRLRSPFGERKTSCFGMKRRVEIALASPVAVIVQLLPDEGRSTMLTSPIALNSRLFQSARYSAYSCWLRPSRSSKGRGMPGLDLEENSRNHLGSLRAAASTLATNLSISRGGMTMPIWPRFGALGSSSPLNASGNSAADAWTASASAMSVWIGFMVVLESIMELSGRELKRRIFKVRRQEKSR